MNIIIIISTTFSSTSSGLIDSSCDISTISRGDQSSQYSKDANVSAASGTSDKELQRCQSDTSVISHSSEKEPTKSRFHSLDSVHTKKLNNNLLKLSFLNSPRSPLHSSMNQSVLHESKLLSEKLGRKDCSYEDLNNISQQLVDTSNASNISLTDLDLQELKISFLESNPLSPKVESPDDKLSDIQETLKRIKMDEVNVEVKKEKVTPEKKEFKQTKSEVEVDNILQKIKSLVKENNRDGARMELNRLGNILNEKPKTLEVPTMIRQDTFDIDPTTGKRKYAVQDNKSGGDNSNGDLMEQLAKLLGTHSLDISSLNVSGSGNGGGDTKVVVIIPKALSPMATPVKQGYPSRRSVSMSSAQKPQSALKAIESKKLSTPMKHSLTPASAIARRSSFTAPRSITKPSPYEQKSNVASAVRKSLMPSMDKTPIKQNGKLSPNNNSRPVTTTAVRRSVSLKSNVSSDRSAVPQVKLTQATPIKMRPKTSTQSDKKLSSTPIPASKRMSTTSTPARPSQSAIREKEKPLITKKTEFKTPFAAKKPTATNGKGSLV